MSPDPDAAIQDVDPGECYGCGARNPYGLQIKSYLVGDECVCDWTPKPYHCAGPAIVYGGVIASLIDCHSAAAAQGIAYRNEGRAIGSAPRIFYITKTLNVEYVKPTPIGGPVRLIARVQQFQGRGAQVACDLFSGEDLCARGDSVFVRVPV